MYVSMLHACKHAGTYDLLQGAGSWPWEKAVVPRRSQGSMSPKRRMATRVKTGPRKSTSRLVCGAQRLQRLQACFTALPLAEKTYLFKGTIETIIRTLKGRSFPLQLGFRVEDSCSLGHRFRGARDVAFGLLKQGLQAAYEPTDL